MRMIGFAGAGPSRRTCPSIAPRSARWATLALAGAASAAGAAGCGAGCAAGVVVAVDGVCAPEGVADDDDEDEDEHAVVTASAAMRTVSDLSAGATGLVPPK
jgi:hypothetical protein